MKLSALDVIVCPQCKGELALETRAKEGAEVVEGSLTCSACGKAYLITKGVPRFVPQDAYAQSFGYQWNWFRTVQLDSINESSESEQALTGATGWSDKEFRGSRLLDAGVGAGRFADRASAKGAEVYGVDLTMAVDAAYRNIGTRPNVHLFQADIFELPFRENTFDLAYSIGVLSKGWKAKANQELIARIKRRLAAYPNVEFVKVSGHAGIPENERCDALARAAVERRG